MSAAPHVLLGLVLLSSVLVGWLAPDRFYGLMQEDAVVEWATFIAFTVAGIYAIVRARRTAGLYRLAAILLAIFTLFVAGEEISWGQRIAAFEPPEVFLEHNYQQELNVHNLLKSVLDTRWMVTIIALVYGVALPLVARSVDRLKPLAPALSLAPWFGAVALLEIFYPFELTGELAEALLGLTFIADVDQRASGKLGAPLQVASMLSALMVTPFLEAAIYGDQPTNVSTVEVELEVLGDDVRAAYRKKLLKKRRVHKRLYTAVKSRYFRFGRESLFLEKQATPGETQSGARRDRRGYFLDVWSQPYWVHYQKKRRQIVLYSFGPNRRRDWDAGEGDPTSFKGDDILVTVDLR